MCVRERERDLMYSPLQLTESHYAVLVSAQGLVLTQKSVWFCNIATTQLTLYHSMILHVVNLLEV